jgi:hypothetical protein
MSELTVMRKESLETALNMLESINNFLKGTGLVIGGVFASIADWIFGGVTVGVFFSSYQWSLRAPNLNPIVAFVVGLILSMGFWGCQILLWQLILEGKLGKFFVGKSAALVGAGLVLFGVLLLKLCDDAMDVTAVYWLLKDNPLQVILPHNIYVWIVRALMMATWILTGFAEVFVSLSIFMLRKGNGPSKSPEQRPGRGPNGHGHMLRPTPQKSTYRPEHKPILGPVAARPAHDEPTYHPINRPIGLRRADDETKGLPS